MTPNPVDYSLVFLIGALIASILLWVVFSLIRLLTQEKAEGYIMMHERWIKRGDVIERDNGPKLKILSREYIGDGVFEYGYKIVK